MKPTISEKSESNIRIPKEKSPPKASQKKEKAKKAPKKEQPEPT